MHFHLPIPLHLDPLLGRRGIVFPLILHSTQLSKTAQAQREIKISLLLIRHSDKE